MEKKLFTKIFLLGCLILVGLLARNAVAKDAFVVQDLTGQAGYFVQTTEQAPPVAKAEPVPSDREPVAVLTPGYRQAVPVTPPIVMQPGYVYPGPITPAAETPSPTTPEEDSFEKAEIPAEVVTTTNDDSAISGAGCSLSEQAGNSSRSLDLTFGIGIFTGLLFLARKQPAN